ncbi:MAG: PVC-type heme-binding CxxCH protein [Verrucomicrobiota bacterium]
MRKSSVILGGLLSGALVLSVALPAAEPNPAAKSKSKAKATGPAIEDPVLAIKKFRVAPGLKVDLWAAEPMVQNLVSFALDEKGRIYAVESHRRRTSVYDIRKHRDWLDADLSFQTVEDRANFLKSKLTPDNPDLPVEIKVDLNGDGVFDWRDLEVESERIRVLTDTDGDGKADHAETFADGFNSIVSGVAAGALAHRGDVFFACIPDIWLLRDKDGDGKADTRTNLFHGFGVHIAYGGHDLHGLRIGPDGRLYFSIADRGTHVQTKYQTIALPHTGAIFRCELDGSNLQVVATGLRNPQELAFDQYGNLFTGDNNADGGDKARWEYVVEGANYGWHYGWQHLPKLGAWNSEKLWEMADVNTAAYLLPPVAHIANGPSGTAYYPGTGMPESFNEHFLLCDFKGADINSGIYSFALKSKGASFELVDKQEFLWNLLVTDVDFGPDGGIYISDWFHGWEKTGKGRIYRAFHPDYAGTPQVKETQKILAEGMDGRSHKELAALLGHPDMRVRMEAQFTLAAAGTGRREVKYGKLELRLPTKSSLRTLSDVARKGDNLLARLHAIWALGQVARNHNGLGLLDLPPLLHDDDPEIRAQAAKIFGDARYEPAVRDLRRLVNDPNPRTRFFATMALGKIGRADAVPDILDMVRTNDDEDPYLRHAAVMALTWMNNAEAVFTAAADREPSARMVALLAMRRLQRPEVSSFLIDVEPSLVLEAARAINDVPIEAAIPRLAVMIARTGQNEPTLRRIINACFRVGTPEAAQALAHFAATSRSPAGVRAEAVEALGDWGQPSPRDRVTGLWHPLPARSGKPAEAALLGMLDGLLRTTPDEVRIATANAVARLGATDAAPTLHSVFKDTSITPEVRVAILNALAALKDVNLPQALALARSDASELVRRAASRLLGKGSDALAEITATLEKGALAEKQIALENLAAVEGKEADALVARWLRWLIDGKVDKALQLDVLNAALKRKANYIKELVKQYEAKLDPKDAIAPFRPALHGGDAKHGREIFFERQDVACLRCHKVKGEGGDVGPELAGIGQRQPREYILESIILPNKVISPGFENVLITMKSGTTYAGIVKAEDAEVLTLNSPEDGLLKLKKADIQSRIKGQSSMLPELGTVLTKSEIRDLIEFLATLK